MRFILQMARRELRSSWRRLLFFFACIAIGVCAIVALRSMIQNVNRSIARDGRAILPADLKVDTDRPWEDQPLAVINRIAQPPRVTARTETIESATMVRPADEENERAMMIELKGIESPYPLAGDFVLSGNQPFDMSVLANNGAIVSPALLDRLRLQVGDAIKIGEATFQIRATFEKEPGLSGGFRLGPRVFIERSAVEA